MLKEKKKAVKKIADKEFFEVEKVAQLAAKTLSTGKAEDIVTIDLTGKSALADFLVVATGRAPRHVTALAEQVQTKLKKTGVKATLEGEDVGDWVIADAGGVIVHVFTPEARDMYRIEELWGEETPKKSVRTGISLLQWCISHPLTSSVKTLYTPTFLSVTVWTRSFTGTCTARTARATSLSKRTAWFII